MITMLGPRMSSLVKKLEKINHSNLLVIIINTVVQIPFHSSSHLSHLSLYSYSREATVFTHIFMFTCTPFPFSLLSPPSYHHHSFMFIEGHNNNNKTSS